MSEADTNMMSASWMEKVKLGMGIAMWEIALVGCREQCEQARGHEESRWASVGIVKCLPVEAPKGHAQKSRTTFTNCKNTKYKALGQWKTLEKTHSAYIHDHTGQYGTSALT